MVTLLATAREAFRTRLWPIPTIAVVLAVGLGLGVPALDEVVDGELSDRVSAWLFGGDADAARSLLGAIASSMITVTALTFSLTVVTLQLASSQFSPRLLRTFTRDRFVQVTLALFLATFTYALTVLRAIRGSGDDGGAELVPQVAVTLAFVLAIASVLALVLFLAHLTEQIRVETMLRNVHREAVATLGEVLEEREPGGAVRPPPPSPPSSAADLLARGDGFVTWIDRDGLLAVATEEDVVLGMSVDPGSFVVAATPLGSLWARDLRPLSSAAVERVGDRVASCVRLGFERTSAQDVGFGLRQLVDVAVKALSPGVNDPTTAVHALGHISALLCSLSDRDLGPRLLADDDGRTRVVLHGPDLADLVALALAQPRKYGAADAQVMQKVLQVLLDLSRRVSPDQRAVVLVELERTRRVIARETFDDQEATALEETESDIRRTLARSAA
ncbi:DUF2254 domain-containing protein [Nocardioides aestuarii]|uniref:DUF2254 domain-containing protein n=1 Tax=Nocardioides aestuarii TaxID=252231 RepID=A0ABW4TLN7_9ACTN